MPATTPQHPPAPLPASSLKGGYAELARLSAAMLDAARRGDWEEVASYEGECARRTEELRRLPSLSSEGMDSHERENCIALIQQILADDAAIRDLAHPRMKELEQILRPRRHRLPGYASFR
ncbi:MAG: flagellar protein FliT [Pigmentiphaga sp.]|uniref:flagellar protein FliT n=1 Tax=Pigmentiphaga sp. TaxID=1977564 RepID=UPI0029B3C019|nr:flagellar protein FliT [Pigmentiphaga sp.]MDX3904135.1 flagellar protein FliT [Pigmentiphaga sp.]